MWGPSAARDAFAGLETLQISTILPQVVCIFDRHHQLKEQELPALPCPSCAFGW